MRESSAVLAFPHHRKLYVAVLAAVVAFLAYTCVYAYRKPFTAATYSTEYWNINYQTLLIMSQVAGYMLSKFAGIRVISELKKSNRMLTGVGLILIAWLCLLVFAVVPDIPGLVCMFVNGFALGFLWGIIFSYVEGRTLTDFIGAVMAISFIFAGGFTRSVAVWVLTHVNSDPKWMPFLTGILFIVPAIGLFALLEKLPPPDEEDLMMRENRKPLFRTERKQVLHFFGAGLFSLICSYVLLTVLRDIRDNYMVNMWGELGYGNDYSIFTQTESVSSITVLVAMACLAFVRKNIRALNIIHWMIAAGLVSATLASILFLNSLIEGWLWMQMVSIGLYIGYIPFNCILFERLIATFRISGTVGFLMYLADSFGYLGSAAVMLIKEFTLRNIQWTAFYGELVIYFGLFGIAGILYSLFHFKRKHSWIKNAP